MLQATLSDGNGNTLALASDQLEGWGIIGDIAGGIKSAGEGAVNAVKSGTKAVGGVVGDVTNKVASTAYSGVKWAANQTCGLVSNPLVQTGANMYAPGSGSAAAAVCGVVSPPALPGLPNQSLPPGGPPGSVGNPAIPAMPAGYGMPAAYPPAYAVKKPFFRADNPGMWAAIVGGAAVVGGGIYFVARG